MVDGEFDAMVSALARLLPAQLVVLETAVKARMAVVKAQIAVLRASSSEPVAGTPKAPGPMSVPPIAAPSIAAIEARFAQAPECPHSSARIASPLRSRNGVGPTP